MSNLIFDKAGILYGASRFGGGQGGGFGTIFKLARTLMEPGPKARSTRLAFRALSARRSRTRQEIHMERSLEALTC